MSRFFSFVALLVISLICPQIAKRLTQGFRVAKMELCFPNRDEWDVPFDPSITPLLQQNYIYLGKGAQCYVFESEDQKYVIKLFRFDRPLKEEKVLGLFQAAKLAFDELKEETGLVFLHLNKTELNLPVLKCKDPLGRSLQFPLDKMRFALQKKAHPILSIFEEAKKNNQINLRIDQFFTLLKKRADHHIHNSDSNLSRNFGFLDDRAIEFDFGSYRKCEDLNVQDEIQRFAKKLRRWLVQNDPGSLPYFDEKAK